jgi:ketosteroid isomerase-like protein
MSADALPESAGVLRTFGTALERGDAEAAAECFAPDAVYEEPPRFSFVGRAAIYEFVRDFTARHRAVSFSVMRALASPERALVAAEWQFSYIRASDGTHVSFAGMSFVEVEDGQIARWRGYSVAMSVG